MFSILYFAVLVIGAIEKNDFEIRHSIELGNEDAAEINVNDVTKEVKDELDQLLCTGYTEKNLVDECSIEGMIEIKMDFLQSARTRNLAGLKTNVYLPLS